MKIQPDDPRNQQVIDCVNELSALFSAREEGEEVAMSAMMIMVGTILGHLCPTEDSLLRAITLACDGIRSSATDTFVANVAKRRARRQR